MKINLEYAAPKQGKFASVKLNYEFTEGIQQNCEIWVDYSEAFKRIGLPKNDAFDLFLMGVIIYGIDNAVNRENLSVNGWARELEVSFPVNNPKKWQSEKENLEKALNFLTGDIWDITFIKHAIDNYYLPSKKDIQGFTENQNSLDEHAIVSLFSGGLDSLIGIIDQCESINNGKLLLASHSDGNYPGVKSDQNKTYEFLENKYHDILSWTRVRVSLNNISERGDFNNEITTRSRSFLFLSIGVLLANMISDTTKVLIPENGTIAINHPLSSSRRSSCSTRTAHPYFLSALQAILHRLGLTNIIFNPYEYKTKGEMAEECKNRDVLNRSVDLTCSCAKRGHNNHWDLRKGTQHCGRCMPCLYRRVALNKIDADSQTYGVDIFNTSDSKLEQQDLIAFFDYLKTDLTIEAIEKNLLVNGTLPLDKLRSYASVIERTRSEIKSWIMQKGSSKIKRKVGL